MSEHNLSAREYAALLRWKMCDDPISVPSSDESAITTVLNREAESRGYRDWVEAYHELHGESDE